MKIVHEGDFYYLSDIGYKYRFMITLRFDHLQDKYARLALRDIESKVKAILEQYCLVNQERVLKGGEEGD